MFTPEENTVIGQFILLGWQQTQITGVVDFFTGLIQADQAARDEILGQLIGFCELNTSQYQSELDALEAVKQQRESMLSAKIHVLNGLKTKLQSLVAQ